jgi:hypothetical protein
VYVHWKLLLLVVGYFGVRILQRCDVQVSTASKAVSC